MMWILLDLVRGDRYNLSEHSEDLPELDFERVALEVEEQRRHEHQQLEAAEVRPSYIWLTVSGANGWGGAGLLSRARVY